MTKSATTEHLDLILSSQNADGGFGYGQDVSWTEPTVYAVLALLANRSEGADSRIESALNWLIRTRRSDGTWAPNAQVDQSTWVTGLVLLLAPHLAQRVPLEPSIQWLLHQSGRESGFIYRLRSWMMGAKLEQDETHDGWPWFPDTAAWVTPTALTILALRKLPEPFRSATQPRLDSAQKFLLSRMCKDGGWNHGSSRALGYDASSYPETTGVALLALHGVQSPKLPTAIAAAQRHLVSCRSAEGVSWLQMGLLAHHSDLPEIDESEVRCFTVMDAALRILARQAQGGANVFI